MLQRAARFRSSGVAIAAIRELMACAGPSRVRLISVRFAARALAALLAALAAGAVSARAQDEQPFETEILAVRRVLPNVGPGLRGVCRGPGGNYYVLTAPGSAVAIYDPTGKRIGQVPAHPAGGAAIVYGESMDVDSAGRIVVADRGAGGVKVYAPDGTLSAFIHMQSAESVAFLEGSEGSEVAVASASAARLVTIYDTAGRPVREFGNSSDVTDQSEISALSLPRQQENMGLIARDAASNVYFAFAYLPEPTVLKYDRLGYAQFDMIAKIPELAKPRPSEEQVYRNERARVEGGGSLAPPRVVTAMGVDQDNQDLWVSAGTLLVHFDKDGNHLASYRTYTSEGGRLEVTLILVERDRLLLGADPFGLYEFTRPDKITH